MECLTAICSQSNKQTKTTRHNYRNGIKLFTEDNYNDAFYYFNKTDWEQYPIALYYCGKIMEYNKNYDQSLIYYKKYRDNINCSKSQHMLISLLCITRVMVKLLCYNKYNDKTYLQNIIDNFNLLTDEFQIKNYKLYLNTVNNKHEHEYEPIESYYPHRYYIYFLQSWKDKIYNIFPSFNWFEQLHQCYQNGLKYDSLVKINYCNWLYGSKQYNLYRKYINITNNCDLCHLSVNNITYFDNLIITRLRSTCGDKYHLYLELSQYYMTYRELGLDLILTKMRQSDFKIRFLETVVVPKFSTHTHTQSSYCSSIYDYKYGQCSYCHMQSNILPCFCGITTTCGRKLCLQCFNYLVFSNGKPKLITVDISVNSQQQQPSQYQGDYSCLI